MGVNLLPVGVLGCHAFAVPVLGHERRLQCLDDRFRARQLHVVGDRGARVDPGVGAPRARGHRVCALAMVGTEAGVRCLSVRHQPVGDGRAGDGARVSRWAACAADDHVWGCTTSHRRHAMAKRLRCASIVINLSSTTLPLVFGAAGAAVGVAALFWSVGAATAASSLAGTSSQNLMHAAALVRGLSPPR